MVDTRRLLEEMCQAAIAILPCNFAWLLVVQDSVLRSEVVVSDRGTSASEVFLRLIAGGTRETPTFSTTSGDNPLSEVVLSGIPSVNVATTRIKTIAGGEPLHRALHQLRLKVVHLLPLISPDPAAEPSTVGMMVLGSRDENTLNTERGTNLLEVLTRQAVTVVENARLVASLAKREEQMRIEQAFRRMVLDTMGDSLIVIDEAARIRYVNNRLLFISGYTRQELYGNSVGAIFHPTGREPLVEALKRGGRRTLNFSQLLVTKDGRVLPVLMSRATAPSVEFGGQSTVIVLSDLTEQKRREAVLEKQGERLRAINRAVQSITSALTLEEVIPITLKAAFEVVEPISGCILLRDDEDPSLLRVVIASGPQAATMQDATARVGEGIVGMVVRDCASQIVQNVPGGVGFEREGTAVLAVPLVVAERAIGAIEVINKAEGAFARDDLEMLENLAAAASVAIEKARLIDHANRRVNELTTLLESSEAASSTLNINGVLEVITRRLRGALNVSRCSIATWDQAANRLSTIAEACDAYWAVGKGPERAAPLALFSTGLLHSGRVLIARSGDPTLDWRVRSELARLGMSSLILAPLRFSQTAGGIVELYRAFDQPQFTALNLQQVEDTIAHWHEGTGDLEDWHHQETLTDLANRLLQASKAAWCVISLWDRRERKAIALREIGFAAWEEGARATMKLEDHATVKNTLDHGLPITFFTALLRDDPNELRLMEQAGAHTGLVTPLLMRGKASGLVKLLDVDANRTFDVDEISLCQGIANVVANALENARLYQSLERRANLLQAAYDDLREADKLKDSLIQNVAHEVKTPLHKMSMQLELMSMGEMGPLTGDLRESTQMLIKWATELGEIINNMLSLNKLASAEMQFGAAHIEMVIKRAVETAQQKIRLSGHQVILKIDPNLPPVRADASRLAEVFDQLIDNAIKFSPNADRIEIYAWDPGGPTIQACVQDHGIGIDPAEFERIFQRGYQVEGGLTRRFGGTGIGLTIARGVVEAHGGKIWVESAPGQGSKFHLTLPRWTEEN